MNTKESPRGPLEPIVGRLRELASALRRRRYPGNADLVNDAADEIERLQAALAYARNGFELAYSAAERGFNEEVLLHCGHHGAAADRAIQPPN